MKTKWLLLVCIVLVSCTRVMHVADIQQRNYLITSSLDSLPVEVSLITEIAPYKIRFEEEMGRIIGEVAENLVKKQPESNLTHWMADVLYRQTAEVSGQNIDVTILNYGGIRLPNIPEGPITVGKVYELMPFDNHIVTIQIPGSVLLEVFELIAFNNGGWPVCQNVKMTIKEKKLEEVLIRGERIDESAIYTLATTSFIADGGEGLGILLNLERRDFDLVYRDAILKDITEQTARGQKIQTKGYGRMMVKTQ